MKTAKDILLENIPKDCWWAEMENITNTPVEYVTKAMESFAAQSVREKDKLLKAIRFATYARDTDDAILYEIKKLLTEGGYPDEADD